MQISTDSELAQKGYVKITNLTRGFSTNFTRGEVWGSNSAVNEEGNFQEKARVETIWQGTLQSFKEDTQRHKIILTTTCGGTFTVHKNPRTTII